MNTDDTPSVAASLASGYYSLVNLALASATYYPGNGTDSYGSAFTQMIGGLTPLPPPQGAATAPWSDSAKWSLEWGPATNPDDANLAYVATFGDGQTNYLRVVGLRGTETNSTKFGDYQQLIEDLQAFAQLDWMAVLDAELKGTAASHPYNPFGRGVAAGFELMVAAGSYYALKSILDCQVVPEGAGDVGDNLIQHLHQQADLEATPLVVTGHSLGGALTQMVSAYLGWQIVGAFSEAQDIVLEPVAKNIFPVAFAPPTVGSPAFADRYSHIFPAQFYFVNDGDVVPHAWTDVEGIESLWRDYPQPDQLDHVACPSEIVDTINKYGPDVPPYQRPNGQVETFQQPYLGDPIIMGEFLKEANMLPLLLIPWLAQLVWQHFPPAYYLGIKSTSLHLADYPSFNKIPAGLTA